ncbi:DUF2255 domain-containing protein [Christiangramia fulva]|uniref:DUF2255 domain-containing protein n=1 Tax=Christiangramia fulva TaxID=2126553 RepID=A0A2R3Z279_9FLAO|nr:DUF2255 family protein [Christiangramia fulva]AVR44380.1 DUF2255 domain-containing protein [Christiangramia fulva]
MFPKDFYSYLANNTLVEIKGGLTRPSFLKIWMVEVDKRIFARSWNKSERSWFTEFQKTGIGEIKFGDKVIRVKGKKINASNPINQKISEAYLKKYDQPGNLKYAEGISQPEYFEYTMEFFHQEPH